MAERRRLSPFSRSDSLLSHINMLRQIDASRHGKRSVAISYHFFASAVEFEVNAVAPRNMITIGWHIVSLKERFTTAKEG